MTPLPVGFRRLNPDPFLNYQLNRLVACGFVGPERLAVGSSWRTPEQAAAGFQLLAEQAAAEGAWREAAACQRGAEFFTPHTDPRKRPIYERFQALFARAIEGSGAERHPVPWRGGFLPAWTLPSSGEARGTVLFFGGFDSLIEEFFCIWERLAAAGWHVVAFEGPGQGGALVEHGLTFDHDFEGPVGAVLDHFRLDGVTLVGLSMGGYWAIRAAGREPRVARVVAWPPVYDWLFQVPALFRPWVHRMVRWRRFMLWSIRVRTRMFPVLHHAVQQATALCGGRDALDAVRWLLSMNERHLGSERVTQDVLLLVGEHDAFQPPRLAGYQERALTNARSVSVRVFRAHEHADQHCQMGNLELACGVLTTWLATGRVG